MLTVDNTELCCNVSYWTFVAAYTQNISASISYQHFNNVVYLETYIALHRVEWTNTYCCEYSIKTPDDGQ